VELKMIRALVEALIHGSIHLILLPNVKEALGLNHPLAASWYKNEGTQLNI
jgi:hypothetical protein